MTNRSLIIAIFSLICCSINAQNCFVYLRFDESTNNVSAINQMVQDMIDTHDDVVLFYNHQSYQGNNLAMLLDSRDFLSNISVYEPYSEMQELCSTMEQLLAEVVIPEGLSIDLHGKKDNQWKLYFIVPETAGRNDLIKWLDINGFMSRNISLTFITYDQYTEMNTLSLSQFIENVDDLLVMKF